jgi:hypothetical protein
LVEVLRDTLVRVVGRIPQLQLVISVVSEPGPDGTSLLRDVACVGSWRSVADRGPDRCREERLAASDGRNLAVRPRRNHSAKGESPRPAESRTKAAASESAKCVTTAESVTTGGKTSCRHNDRRSRSISLTATPIFPRRILICRAARFDCWIASNCCSKPLSRCVTARECAAERRL